MGESVDSHPVAEDKKSLKEIFEDLCPYFMSIGMSYDEFWYNSPDRCIYYLKAHKLRQKQHNEEMWLQGYYTYIALASVSPVLHAFAKKGTKPLPYLKEPLAITKEDAERKENEQRLARKKAFFAKLMQSSKKGGSKNG